MNTVRFSFQVQTDTFKYLTVNFTQMTFFFPVSLTFWAHGDRTMFLLVSHLIYIFFLPRLCTKINYRIKTVFFIFFTEAQSLKMFPPKIVEYPPGEIRRIQSHVLQFRMTEIQTAIIILNHNYELYNI